MRCDTINRNKLQYIFLFHTIKRYPPTPAACWGSASEKHCMTDRDRDRDRETDRERQIIGKTETDEDRQRERDRER